MHEVFQDFSFDAAHHFPRADPGHKYRGLHGHSFDVRVVVEGRAEGLNGFVLDLGKLEQDCSALRAALDHHYLNDIPGLATPSLESIASWIWNRLAASYSGLKRVEIRRRSSRHGCVYFGPDSRAKA
jgi:6-pyruvoyltetrahydropterin/6-carboxytetrahydropterin synthase